MLGGLVRAEAPGPSLATERDDVAALARLGLSLLGSEPTEMRAVLAAAAASEVPGSTDAADADAEALARACEHVCPALPILSLIHISEPTRLGMISYAVFCLKK